MSQVRLTPTDDGQLELRITRNNLFPGMSGYAVTTLKIRPDEVEHIRDVCEGWLEWQSQELMKESIGVPPNAD